MGLVPNVRPYLLVAKVPPQILVGYYPTGLYPAPDPRKLSLLQAGCTALGPSRHRGTVTCNLEKQHARQSRPGSPGAACSTVPSPQASQPT
jgi:hypothetical protein